MDRAHRGKNARCVRDGSAAAGIPELQYGRNSDIQKPGSVQTASRRFPSVASSDIWLDTKIICPGDRWNQPPSPVGSRLPSLGFQGRSPWLLLDDRSVESYPIKTFSWQNGFMPFITKRQPLTLSAADRKRLEDLRRSRSAEKRQVLHAAILLESANGASDNSGAVANGVNRHTVALCVRKFLQFGIDAALGELPRPGKSRRIPDDAIAWVLHCACQKPKDLGYSYELWTYNLLQSHVRKHCVVAGHPSLLELSRSKLHRILTQGEVRPHKIRYYVERRDPEVERRME